MSRIFALIVAFLFVSVASAGAQEFTQRQQEIFRTTAAVDGYLTEKLHNEFWETIKSSPAYYPGAEREMSAVLGPMILDGLDFQKETWASIEKSYAARTAIRTDGYVAARQKLESSPVPEVRAAVLPSLQKADDIIQAAADRASYSSGDLTLFITPELIEQMKTGLDASFFRMQLLTNPTWDGKPKEWQLNEARLRVVSALPFTFEQQDLALANGVSAKSSTYSLNLDGQNFVGLSSVQVAAKINDSEAALTRIAHGSLAAMGISSPSVITMNFRGGTSAVAAGQTQTADGPVYGSLRAIRPSGRDDIVLFLAVSTTSQIDADGNRANLEMSTVVD